MRLRDLLDETSVKIGLESADKEECMEEMVDILVRSGRLTDRAGALQALTRRESQGTTGIGKGVALPHGKHASVPALVAAVGTSADGIEFDAMDGESVHVVILLLASSNESGPHVQALAEVARLLTLPGFYRKTLAASSARELLDLIESEE
jgi:mannitol/fructose-specific phosphotransferase system IIA component (Ntr-type)